jgi:uncharacterized membrane protein YesL
MKQSVRIVGRLSMAGIIAQIVILIGLVVFGMKPSMQSGSAARQAECNKLDVLDCMLLAGQPFNAD